MPQRSVFPAGCPAVRRSELQALGIKVTLGQSVDGFWGTGIDTGTSGNGAAKDTSTSGNGTGSEE